MGKSKAHSGFVPDGPGMMRWEFFARLSGEDRSRESTDPIFRTEKILKFGESGPYRPLRLFN